MQIPFQEVKTIYLDNNPDLKEQIDSFIAEWNSIESFKCLTSGSTGTPKDIVIRKDLAIASANATGNRLNLSKGDKAYLCISPDTIGGKMMIIRSIVLDLDLYVGKIASNPFNEKTPEYDLIAMVPMQVRTCIDELVEMNKIKNLIIGGAPISPSLEQDIIDLELDAYQTFGMTETISHIALRKLSDRSTSFKTLPGVSVSTDEKNHLVIHAPHLNIENLRTNDVVELISDTEFNWIGRSDFVINSGGYKIHPEQLERLIVNLIDQPYFVAGISDDKYGECVVLCIEGDQSIKKEDFDFLENRYMIPKEIYFFEKFHYSSGGKISRIETMNNLQHARKQVL